MSRNKEKLRRNVNVSMQDQVNERVSLIKTVKIIQNKIVRNKLELTGSVTALNRKACFNTAFGEF